MSITSEVDPSELPIDPDSIGAQPPLGGTDDDSPDDERPDENEAPVRELSDRIEAPEEFRADERDRDDATIPDDPEEEEEEES